jgi:chromosomal replication initiator protein
MRSTFSTSKLPLMANTVPLDQEQIWHSALAELELSVSKANFTTWLKKTTLNAVDGTQATIGVPNLFTKTWLQQKYHKQIVKALKNCTENKIFQVMYEIGAKPSKPISIAPVVPQEKTQVFGQETMANTATVPQPQVSVPANYQSVSVDDESNLNPRYTFEAYVVGPSNELAHAACKSVAATPGTQYNPLFIYGGVGLGKTHLMHAIGNEIHKRSPEKKIRYVTSERFTNEFIDSISNKGSDFKARYRDVDILIVDDIQFIAGKEQTQQEFFHTFNTLHGTNKQIVLSSDRPPKAIPTLEDRLRSRFEGGMIADVGSPELETRVAILREKCRLKGYQIDERVVSFIAANIQHNIRELEGALNRVVAHCQLKNVTPTTEIAKSVLANIISNPRRRGILPRQIIEIVAQFYDLSIDDLVGASRKKEIVRPRQIAMFLMREEIKSSFPAIGNELGGRDHTTAMHATDKISREVEADEAIRQELDLIRQRLYIPQ